MEEGRFGVLESVGGKTYFVGLLLSSAAFISFVVFAHRVELAGARLISKLLGRWDGGSMFVSNFNLLLVFFLIALQAHFVFKMEKFELYAILWSATVLIFFVVGSFRASPGLYPFTIPGYAAGILGPALILLYTRTQWRVAGIAGFSMLLVSWVFLITNLGPLDFYWRALNAGFPIPWAYGSVPALHPLMFLMGIATGLSPATIIAGIAFVSTIGPGNPASDRRFKLFLLISSAAVAIALLIIAKNMLHSIDLLRDIISIEYLSKTIPPSITGPALLSTEIGLGAAIIMLVGAILVSISSLMSLIAEERRK